MLVQNRRSTTKNRYNKAWCEIEIESIDHDASIVCLWDDDDWNKTNVSRIAKYDLGFMTSSNKSAIFSATKTVDIDKSGQYRVLIFGMTNTAHNHFAYVNIGNKQLKTESMQTVDEFVRCFDLGKVTLKEGSQTLKIWGNSYAYISMVCLMSIQYYHGNSDGDGDLKIKTATFTNNGIDNIDTCKVEILHNKKFERPNLSDYHKSGLVFEYMDPINIKMGENKRKLDHQFGGYITYPTLSENRLTINIEGADRLQDMADNQIMKEVTIAGAVTDLQSLTYKASNLYDAVKYMLEATELPLKSTSIKDTLINEIQHKDAFIIDMTTSANYNKADVVRINRSLVKASEIGRCVVMRNHYKKNITQKYVAWSSSWNKHEEVTGFNFKNNGVFWIEYGLGDKPDPTITKKKTIIVKNKLKSGKTSKGTKKTVTTKKVDFGYDTQAPFQAWIELDYSITPKGTIKTVAIDFTSTTTTNKLGEIDPVLAYDTWARSEFDVINVLNTMDPQGAYYIRNIRLYAKNGSQDLYDPKNEEDTHHKYKMAFKRCGFKSGSAIVPEVLKLNGKTPAEGFKTLCERLKLSATVVPATERRNDTVYVEKIGSKLCDFEIVEGDNLLDQSNEKYSPNGTLKNAITKVFKNTNGNYSAVRKVDPLSIAHFRTKGNYEVLNENPGVYNARFQAIQDLEDNSLPNWTYTAKVWGLPPAHIGRLVPCTFENSYYNDIKTIKSIECNFVNEGKKVSMTLGLDDVDKKIRSKSNQRKLRKSLLPSQDYIGGAEYEDAVTID